MPTDTEIKTSSPKRLSDIAAILRAIATVKAMSRLECQQLSAEAMKLLELHRQRKGMKHLYEVNEDTELYAADSPEQAEEQWMSETGEKPEYVKQVPDDEKMPECSQCGHSYGTAADLAETVDRPVQVSTCYN